MMFVGTIVRIKKYHVSPSFWDESDYMLGLSRSNENFEVVEVRTGNAENVKLYVLKRISDGQQISNYVWREKDLIVGNTDSKDPNFLFKMKKVN